MYFQKIIPILRVGNLSPHLTDEMKRCILLGILDSQYAIGDFPFNIETKTIRENEYVTIRTIIKIKPEEIGELNKWAMNKLRN